MSRSVLHTLRSAFRIYIESIRREIDPMKCRLILLLLTISITESVTAAALEPVSGKPARTRDHFKRSSPSGCTVITLVKGESVWFGGNDDYIHPDSYYWVDPGDGSRYGAIWIGQPDNVQQGVNEKGLAYDANGLPRVDVNPHTERLSVSGGYTSYPLHILHACATVEEVIEWVRTHRWHAFMHDQMHFADAMGDAVIISAGADDEVVFTRKPKGDGFLVSTNFNVARPSNGFGYPCRRYNLAQEMLRQLLNEEGSITFRDITDVLDGVHVQGVSGWTIESLVADLRNGMLYLYYFYQFDRPVVLNIKEELSEPRDPGPLSQLFPEEVRKEADRRFHQIQRVAGRCKIIGKAWAGLVMISLILLFVLSRGGQHGMRFWIPAVTLLGPMALLVLFLAGRTRQPGPARTAFVESTGDIMPSVVGFLIILIINILVPGVQMNYLIQITLVFILPVLVGWLVFHGPLLTAMADTKAGVFFIRRLLQVWVAANLGMARINIVAMPLVNRSVQFCNLRPLTVWAVCTWWAIVVLGTLPGMLLLYFYERWSLQRGCMAWSVLVLQQGEAKTPSWHEAWWWIPVSFAVLICGLAAGVIIQRI